jgi:cell wall-associated NlpC family hydrolase
MIKESMKRLVSLIFFIILFSLYSPFPIFAISATSNVVCTKIGNPQNQPSECNNEFGQKAVELARAQIGKPYVWASPSRTWKNNPPEKAPGSFDCSGLVGWSWYWASNGKVNMAGQTNTDWNASGYQKFSASQKAELRPGDILYWTNGDVHHTAIYSGACQKSSGDDCFIEAQQSGVPILESHLSSRLNGSDPLVGFLRPVLQ